MAHHQTYGQYKIDQLPPSTLKQAQNYKTLFNSLDTSILNPDIKLEESTTGVGILNKDGITYTKEIYRIDEFPKDEEQFVQNIGDTDTSLVSIDGEAPVSYEEEQNLTQTGGVKMPAQRNYNVNFATDFVITQLNNNFNSNFYQRFTGPQNVYPGFSFYIKYGMSDLFEDYRLVGGFRLGFNLNNNNYLLYYENIKRRFDKRITLERQVQEGTNGFSLVKLKSHQISFELKYPLSEVARVESRVFYRLDNTTTLSTDNFNLRVPDRYSNTLGLKLAFVFDNTISKGLNLYNGWRMKFWGEYYFEPEVKNGTDGIKFNPIAANSDIFVVGFDVRQYLKVHRDIILAFRVAGNTSFGSRKLIHYLGGTDNWLIGRKTNLATPIDFSQNYFYQTTATPLRGFFINSRNGASMAVANVELRWPIFKYFINSPIKSDFIKNFQLIGFSDIGSAWNGPSPYSEENKFNERVINHNPFTITVDSNRDPVIYGYGFGLRTRLLGYFMRASWAWGVDDGIVLPVVFYFSLSLDF